MVVAKFGGSSLADSRGYLRVADFIKSMDIPVAVTSAPGGKKKVTDLLIASYRTWEKTGSPNCPEFDEVKDRFTEIAIGLNMDISPRLAALEADISAGCGYDYAVSRGEFLSAYILASLLGYKFIDATECVKFTIGGQIDFPSTMAHGVRITQPCVIPGFYGFMPSGKVKLMVRGGSDISGALIASVLNAEYWKCTDVCGIFDGFGGVIERLSYDEAEALCFFGATVMQYESIAFLRKAGVRLTVRGLNAGGTIVGTQNSGSVARSSKEMYLVKDGDIGKIEQEGLKVAFYSNLIGSSEALVDGNGFSEAAIRRILGEAKKVKVTAVIGPKDECDCGKLLFCGEKARLYLSAVDKGEKI